MARWKLTQNCTLPIDGVYFEQRLTTNTGRPCVEKWPAHQLFIVEDPADPAMLNDVDDMGMPICVVGTKPFKRDFVIDPAALKKGWQPNPGMEPLDAEAKAISARIPRNVYPMSEAALPTSMSPIAPQPDALAELKNMILGLGAQVQALTERNAILEERLAEEPLEEVEVPDEVAAAN